MKKLISMVLALLMLAGCVQIALAAEAPNGFSNTEKRHRRNDVFCQVLVS